MKKEMKKTPLHGWHTVHGANMAVFGGYHMPLWYPPGVREEHLAVLTKAGIFDTSHMAVVMIVGKGAFELLQLCFTRNMNACVGKDRTPLEPGRCVYGAYLNSDGGVIDDAIIYYIEENVYMTVVNTGMGGKIARHLMSHADPGNIGITDLTDKVGKIDIQGPMAAKILLRVLADHEGIFEGMPYFTFKGHFDKSSPLAGTALLANGVPVLLSRTGYTGEFGFEIFLDTSHLVAAWEMIMEAGEAFGLMPCGLAARDSLRVGAVLPLSHQDIGLWPFINNPWPFALSYNAGRTGFIKEFIGDRALMNVDKPEYTYAFAGYDLRKVAVHDNPVVLDPDGNKIGEVLTCVSDMAIGRYGDRIYSIASPDRPEDFVPRGLCCGFVKVKSELIPGQIVELKDNRRKIEVMIVDDIRPDRTARRSIVKMI